MNWRIVVVSLKLTEGIVLLKMKRNRKKTRKIDVREGDKTASGVSHSF